jgi:hypothetical protein
MSDLSRIIEIEQLKADIERLKLFTIMTQRRPEGFWRPEEN